MRVEFIGKRTGRRVVLERDFFANKSRIRKYAETFASLWNEPVIVRQMKTKPRGFAYRKIAVKRNPALPRAVHRAARLYRAFTGHRATRARRAHLRVPKVAVAIGPVLMIGYETVRDGRRERYVHRFARKARPTLAVSDDGRQLVMLGGAYHFTDRGIVDRVK
ncbi:MAG: hypothetical protein RML32_04970 [Gammaproteobacteria bacterium]|nr:hypothetical protein [Gammaproteobacteria bacterium]